MPPEPRTFPGTFDSEQELETWVFANITSFFPDTMLISRFQITTASGKNAVPDAFLFSFAENRWLVLECELLSHGVWPHIAEQITRFIVALRNPTTLRTIRDRLFDHIAAHQAVPETAATLHTTPEQLLRRLEVLIEGVSPELAIFIDETNQDLADMADALDIEMTIFRVQKVFVEDTPHYFSPDMNAPILQTQPVTTPSQRPSDLDILDLLGGATLQASEHKFKCYRTSDGSVVHIKHSRYYPEYSQYWYGISTASLDRITSMGITHLVFVMDDHGYVKIPVQLVHNFLPHAGVSRQPDGTVRHYHCFISPPPDVRLYNTLDGPSVPLQDYFTPFD